MWDYKIVFKSGYFEKNEINVEKSDQVQPKKWTRLVGDEAVAARAEKAVSHGLDRFRMIIKTGDQAKETKDEFQPERNRVLSVREIFREYVLVLVKYIKDKYPDGRH